MPPRTRARNVTAAEPKPAPDGARAGSLSEADIAVLRQRLETGKRPRVTLLVDTALGAAGTSVPVVGFGDPADGEFISVGLRDDVVPFAPAELAMPTRGSSSRAKAAGRPVAAADTPPAALPLDPPVEERPATRLRAVPDPPRAPAPVKEPKADARASDTPSPAAAAPSPPAPAPAPAPAAKKAGGRPARTGSLAVTLRFTGTAWTYETVRSGKRSAAKPLNLAAVRAFADRLDDPTLRRDLQSAVDICRQQVQTRAQALRAQLEQVETELAELED